MSILSRYTEWRQGRKQMRVWFDNFVQHIKANPAGQFWFGAGSEGKAQGNPNDPDALTQATKIETWAYVAANVVGKNLSAAPMVAEQQESEAGRAIWTQQDAGPLADLMRRPNPIEPMDVLLWRTMLSLVGGDAYLVHDHAANELYHLHSKYVTIKADRNELIGYVIQRDGDSTMLEPDEVIHLRMPNINDEFYGASPIEPVKTSILTNYWYRRHIRDFFKSGAVPGGLLTSDQQVGESTAEETRKEWDRTHGGPGQGHRIGILGTGLTYQQITSPIGDILNDSLTKMTREEVLAVFGCPPVFAGVFEYANYANAKEQKQFLWENTIMPLQRIIAGYFNVQLVPQYGERLRLKFDVSEIKALQEDETEKVKREVIAVRGGIITANEARERLGLERYEDEGADTLTGTGTFEPFGDEPDGAAGTGDQDDKHLITKVSANRLNRQHGHEASITYGSRLLAAQLRKFFDGQLDRVLHNLDKTGLDGRIPVAKLFAMSHDIKGAGDDISLIFDIDAENLFLGEITDPVIRQMVIQAAKAAAAEIGTTFAAHNPLVETMAGQFETIVKNINRHTYNDILKVLTDGYNDQLTISQIEKRLRGKYAEYYKNRSLTIARTETNGLVNGGHMAAYKDGGVEFTEWSSALLDTSRPWHIDAHGQTVRMGEKFAIGGDMLRYPGDPNGDVSNRVNCMCSVGPSMKG